MISKADLSANANNSQQVANSLLITLSCSLHGYSILILLSHCNLLPHGCHVSQVHLFMGPSQFLCSGSTISHFQGQLNGLKTITIPIVHHSSDHISHLGHMQPHGEYPLYHQMCIPMNTMDYQSNSKSPLVVYEPCQGSNNPFTLKIHYQ